MPLNPYSSPYHNPLGSMYLSPYTPYNVFPSTHLAPTDNSFLRPIPTSLSTMDRRLGRRSRRKALLIGIRYENTPSSTMVPESAAYRDAAAYKDLLLSMQHLLPCELFCS